MIICWPIATDQSFVVYSVSFSYLYVTHAPRPPIAYCVNDIGKDTLSSLWKPNLREELSRMLGKHKRRISYMHSYYRA